MSEENKSDRWWNTLPGLITTITAAVTAIAGLIVAINQTGWLTSHTTPTTAPSSAPAAQSTSTPSAAPVQGATPSSPLPSSSATLPVELPVMRDYKLGDGTFTLLKAELTPETAEKDALKMRLRMVNGGRYPA